VEFRQTAFEYLTLDGDYFEVVPRAEFAGNTWQAGATAPVVTLHFLGETETGPGNPVFYGQARVLARTACDLYVGTQYEAPWGDTEHGRADDHSMLVPYVYSHARIARLALTTSVGYRFTILEGTESIAAAAPPALSNMALTSIAFHAGHDHSIPTVVNPHEDQELLWRATAGTANPVLSVIPFTPSRSTYPGTRETFLEGIVGLQIPVARALAIDTQATLPMTDARRLDWSLSGSVRLR
jgi:hypothetical protein